MFRLDIYSAFADFANREDIPWCVLHGDEGYPSTIGRDLDITCETDNDEERLLAIFRNCLEGSSECKWIIEPDPIWGKRILGVTSSFDVAELHIIRPIRTFIVSLSFEKNRIADRHDLFKHDELLYYFKSRIMPSLNRTRIDRTPYRGSRPLPWWLKEYASALSSDGITRRHKLMFFLNFFVAHPTSAIQNLIIWATKKQLVLKHPATPVFYVDERIDPKELIQCIRNNLGKVFHDAFDVSRIQTKAALRLRATQNFVFHRSRDTVLDNFISMELYLNQQQLFPFILDSFYRFNQP